MLRIQNPIGKALMVTNPVRSFDMARYRRRRHRRSNRRRNPAMSIGSVTTVESGSVPRSGLIPKVKELGGVAGTLIGGTLVFMGSNAIGVMVSKLLAAGGLEDKLGKATGVVKFAARYIGARAIASMAFNANKGLLSHANGRFLVNITIITSGLALLKDLGVLDYIPAQLQDYVPKLSAYDSGVRSSNLSRYGRRLRGYSSGIQRSSLSAYDSGVQRSNLSHANYDNMPVEVQETPTYGVPFGA